jgi:SAM-dependent methyltransferase
MSKKQLEIQQNQYSFPYHYIPSLKEEVPSVTISLKWGLDYLTYMDFILRRIVDLSPNSLLDVGCGDGCMINELHKKNVGFSLEGIDTCQRAIAFANSFSVSEKPLFFVKDLFSISETYDVVSLVEVIEHIPDEVLPSFLEKIFLLASKYVVISVPTTVLPLYEKHFRHYDEELMAEQTKFSNEKFRILEQRRLYKNSRSLKFLCRLFNNKHFHISDNLLNHWLWKFHKKNTYFANEENGYHLVTIYERIS